MFYPSASVSKLTLLIIPPLQVNVEAISDLLPDSFSGTDDSVSSEDFFKKFVSWLGLHRHRFHDNTTKRGAFKHCLNGQALIWWTNLLGSQQPPVTVPDIQAAFFAKYRYRKTRSQLKSELNQCKYQPGQSNIGMMNRFINIADKLEWPVAAHHIITSKIKVHTMTIELHYKLHSKSLPVICFVK